MTDLPVWMRAAMWERRIALVDLAVVFSFAAWAAVGFRPLWLPPAFAAGAAVASGAYRLFGIAVAQAVKRLRRESLVLETAGARRSNAFGKTVASIAFADVTSAYVFKRDLYTTDVVCLALATRDGAFECDERDRGWTEFAEALARHLPGSTPYADWYLDVTREPFVPQLRQIYGMPNTDAGLRAAAEELDAADAVREGDLDRESTPWIPPTGLRARLPAVRDYADAGTSGMFVAVALLTALVSVVHGPRDLAMFALVTLAYLALTRAAVFALLALGFTRI